MSDKDSPAPDAPASPPPLADSTPPAPPAPPLELPAPPAPPPETAEAAAEELLPTIRDHGERLQLAPWQVEAVVRRLHGAHDEDGERVFAEGVSRNTRMNDAEFEQALERALHGRV